MSCGKIGHRRHNLGEQLAGHLRLAVAQHQLPARATTSGLSDIDTLEELDLVAVDQRTRITQHQQIIEVHLANLQQLKTQRK